MDFCLFTNKKYPELFSLGGRIHAWFDRFFLIDWKMKVKMDDIFAFISIIWSQIFFIISINHKYYTILNYM